MAIQAQLCSENLGFALAGPQDLLMDNASSGAGGFNSFCFFPHQQQHQKQHQLLQFDQFQNLAHQKNYSNFLIDDNTNRIPLLHKTNMNDPDQSVSALLEKQRTEIDRFISLQNERLRLALQEQRKQQMAELMKKYESKIQFLLNQKEEEIVKAANRRMELENLLKKMEIDNQTWQRVAKENEAIVATLNSTIERMRDIPGGEGNGAEDAESCCCLEQEKMKKNEESMNLVCRSCNSRPATVVVLPCRHLCSCTECEPFLNSCPVCRMVKKASIHALI